MKKNKKVIINFMVVLIFIYIIIPLNTEAKTINEFASEVAKYTADLKEKESKVATNDQEVAQIKQKIQDIENQIVETQNSIDALKQEIEESNKKIAEKKEQTKKIVEYKQVSDSGNEYLEYIFGSESVTDMIYRASLIEQLTEYNKQVENELNALIESNKTKTEQLNQKTQDMKKLQSDLNSEKERINADSNSLKAAMPGLKEQIKSANENITYFKKLGCGANEDIQRCQYRVNQSSGGSSESIPSTNGFFRPMEFGYMTQKWKGLAHLGVDLSSSNRTIAIYPIASGRIFAKYYDDAGALVVKIRHNTGSRYIYSTYAHLSSFASIAVGQDVSHLDRIGNMGSTGNSTGPHLHLEITTCDWHKGGGCTWETYQRSTIDPTEYVNGLYSGWSNR